MNINACLTNIHVFKNFLETQQRFEELSPRVEVDGRVVDRVVSTDVGSVVSEKEKPANYDKFYHMITEGYLACLPNVVGSSEKERREIFRNLF